MLVGLNLLTSFLINSTLYILLIITVNAVNMLISLKKIRIVILLYNDLLLLNMICTYEVKYSYLGFVSGKLNNRLSSI